MDYVKSKNGVYIRLPEAIYLGSFEVLIATKEIESGKKLVVIYKEVNEGDGFIITAFLTTKTRQFKRRIRIWPP